MAMRRPGKEKQERKQNRPLAKPKRQRDILDELKKQTPKEFFERKPRQEQLERMLPRMGSPKDPEKKSIDQKKKSKEGFEKFDKEKRQRERQGDLYIESVSKGGLLKDILGDKKGTAIYKGKNKDYRILKPVPDKPKPKKSSKGGFFSRSNYKRTGKLI